ncbi:hypothetical protein MIMGU_mgv1a015974mg [Erythranthe guttata]|uniref:Uncharacterized protein n=2 Tax=Erythranthe guttata TaxID=4155 RepID=A0A022Q0F2_ERYGU|nr:hypothetical protein MIMGU_mgv1a015974mg [Erythranthe guttata]
MSRVSELQPQTQGVGRKILVADHQSHKKKAQQHSKNTKGKKVVPHMQKSKFPKSSEYQVPPSVHYYYHGFDSCLKQISAHLAAILDRDAGLDDLPQQPNQGEDEQVKEEEAQEKEAEEEAQEEAEKEEEEEEEETENPT